MGLEECYAEHEEGSCKQGACQRIYNQQMQFQELPSSPGPTVRQLVNVNITLINGFWYMESELGRQKQGAQGMAL